MTTAIDTNILVALWNEDDSLNTLARSALDDAFARGGLVIAAPVFAELLAAPSRNEAFLDSFCKETGISVDWNLGEAVCARLGMHSNFMFTAVENGPVRASGVYLLIS